MKNNYNNSLAKNKVLILYIINTVTRKLTNNDLFKIILEINNMNYFYFSNILGDLVNSKLIITYTKENQEFVEITKEGKNSLDLTLDVLPGIVKLKADSILKKELDNIAEEKSISAEYIPENEKDYTVKCKIVENNKTVFEIKTFAGSNEQAKNIAENWKNNATSIYPKIMELLNI